jgi:hypothetical protein
LNLTKEYATDGNSFLDHLVSHTSGDAFTSSALNYPNQPHNQFVNPNCEHLQTHVHNIPDQPAKLTVDSESTAAEIPTSEPPQPNHTQFDDTTTTNQEHHIPISSSQTEAQAMDTYPIPSLIHYGPAYKPLTSDDLTLPLNFALPILEDLLKQAINVDDDIIPIDINKIKILPLKRKQLDPSIPFDQNIRD